MLIPALVAILALTAPSEDAASDPDQVREIDAIECRLDVPRYNGFALAIEGEEKLAAKRHWKKLPSPNPLMAEYQLPAPITVAGRYRTQRIAFTSDAILAILDQPDPAVIATPMKIANHMDAAPLLEQMLASGQATRAQLDGAIKFRKFMGERIVSDVTEPAADGEGFGAHFTVVQTVSNTTTHPAKTLVGCAYRMQILDKDGNPL